MSSKAKINGPYGKPPKLFRFDLPRYPQGGGTVAEHNKLWRSEIYRRARKAFEAAVARQNQRELAHPLSYSLKDKLDLEVKVKLVAGMAQWKDVDNLLIQVMNALEGKNIRDADGKVKKIIPQDVIIFRAIIEKSEPADGRTGYGHAIVRRL